MFRGYRSAFFAVGLIAIACLGQAQETSNEPDGQAQEQQSPAQTLPLPFPVEIVEDQVETETRERREDEARKREIDDLFAQQGMNIATQAMNDATQHMAYDSRQMTIATWIGVGLLVVTLLLTLQANRAAVAAVKVTREMGQRQMRAYVGVIGSKVMMREDGIVEAILRIQNTGQSPAKYLTVQATLTARPHPSDDPFEAAGDIATERSRAVLGGGRSATIKDLAIPAPFSIEYQNDISAKRAAIFVHGVISYDDVFACPHVTEFRLMYTGDWGGEQSLDVCEEGNNTD